MMEGDGLFMHKNKIYVPNYVELRKLIMNEMHMVPYARHNGYQKEFAAMISQHFCLRMKKMLLII